MNKIIIFCMIKMLIGNFFATETLMNKATDVELDF